MNRDEMMMLAIRHGLLNGPGRPSFPCRVKADPIFHEAIAKAYDQAESRPDDRHVRWAYRCLAGEVSMQFDALTSSGLQFIPSPDPSYPNGSADVFRAIESGTLLVFDGGEDHPILSRKENWQFRAVHDCFGHYLAGASFGPNGEENAYRHHRAMFSPEAIRALTTETRGQNAWVNFGAYRHLTPAERPFAPQKAVILPEWCSLLY
jgi:hypothetical protein